MTPKTKDTIDNVVFWSIIIYPVFCMGLLGLITTDILMFDGRLLPIDGPIGVILGYCLRASSVGPILWIAAIIYLMTRPIPGAKP